MATDPESNERSLAVLNAMQAGIDDPCMIAAMVHAEGSTFGAVLKHEGEVLFGPQEVVAPPVAKPEA